MNSPLLSTVRGLAFAALLQACTFARASEPCPIQLVDVSSQVGISFQHTNGAGGQEYIVEHVLGGLALFDYNGDGLVDIYLLNGAPLKGTVGAGVPPRNVLYRNNGDWSFTDVTEQAGVGDSGYGMGVAAADYDNDGDQDLYVNNFGPNVLYRNNGDGTFTDVTDMAQVAAGNKVGAGVGFLDIEGDGDLDLYASSYVDFTYENHSYRMLGPHRYSDPNDYHPVPDNLFRNDGDGKFTDITDSSGIGAVAGTGMGTVCFDSDQDGDTDVFICNDLAANFLFRNDGRGHFQEEGLLAGVAYNFEGRENGSMGVDCGDYDNDGLADLFMTDFQDEMPVLYHNLGDGFFEDATSQARAGDGASPHVNWGTALVDLDNDGFRDLFIACGHFMPGIHDVDHRTDYRVRNLLLQNMGDATFRDVSDRCGSGLTPVESSKGVGFDDLDNDGDLDAVVLNVNSTPTIMRNDSPTQNHWLQIQLRGVKCNRDGVGSRVRVVAGDLVQTAEVHSGRGYQSHFGTRLQFGLAASQQIDRVEVHWLGGGVDVFANVARDQKVVLTEGTGQPHE
jgi:hypothetical protein